MSFDRSSTPHRPHAAGDGVAQASPALGPGKQTLTAQLPAAPIQRRANAAATGVAEVHRAAAHGTRGPATVLPHGEHIQRLFGRHDIGHIQAHVDTSAAEGAGAMGAEAFAVGEHVAFAGVPDLHTAAHEAAHVVQQRGGAHAVQRKERKDDAQLLEHQASLESTDVEIPALEGALLATRKEAVHRGLLSRASFDAALALSQAMAELQPQVAAKGPVDKGLQDRAALAAVRLFAALRIETAGDQNFEVVPLLGDSTAVTSRNPYTEELRVTTSFLWMSTQHTASWLEQLPGLIRQGTWGDAFRGYRRLLDGLDRWVADQLRKRGKGTLDEALGDALGDAHQHQAQLRTGLEQIASKHAKRLPAIFHPVARTVEHERAAGRPAADAIPMNVYFWKDDSDGTFHLYDLTTPSRPHEQTVDGPPTAATMNTFFEEVARYPEGEVRYTLPGGASGLAPTTGKTKWYEWVGYAGLVVAGAGLALLTAGASIPATVCFAAGAVAGGVSAGGHLADTARLGTATSATVVLDVAQIVAAFASFGVMSVAVKAGSAAAALAGNRWFVPLVGTAASADVVQLVALTDVTVTELRKIQDGAGTPEDKQRAMAVLVTQLLVVSGLTALSVQGARNARALAGSQLELVEQNGVKILRVVGEDTPAVSDSETVARDMRWQMDHKNQSLLRQGEAPRYPDLDAAVKQGMNDLAAAKARGYPYGFKDRATFESFGKALKDGVAGQPTPTHGIAVPTDGAAVQGSALYRPTPSDIDVALLVDPEPFDRLIEQSFSKEVAKVRARGIDPLRMTLADAKTANEKTLANAVQTGIIKRNKVVPRLSDVRDMLEFIADIGVDLSIVKRGGIFDRGPYFPIP